jgi:hypothetical protein
MRPRLRRLVSLWRRPTEATTPQTEDRAGAHQSQDRAGRGEADRRLADAQRRLKQAVPPRED